MTTPRATPADLWEALNAIAERPIPFFHLNGKDYVELREAIAIRHEAREAIGWTDATNYQNPYATKDTKDPVTRSRRGE